MIVFPALHVPDRGLAARVLKQDVGAAVSFRWRAISAPDRGSQFGRPSVCFVHLPDRDLAGVHVLKKNVGKTVAIKVASSDRFPIRPRIRVQETTAHQPVPVRLPDRDRAMLVFWQRMSEWPSSLKSPVPIIFHAGPGLGVTDAATDQLAPFISQTAAWPLLVFCQRMSENPPPLKSPTPTARASSARARGCAGRAIAYE